MINTHRTLLVVALLSGAPLIAAAQSAARFDQAGQLRQTVPGSGSGILTFWRFIGDTTLERLIDTALDANHSVRVADARVSGARAARLGSALDLAPAITATGGYTRQRVSSLMVPGAVGDLPDQDLWDAGLRLSWEVDVFGRGRNALEGHGELVAASEENLRDVQVLIAANVADAYFELRGAQHRLAVAERNAENQRGTLEITVQRLEGGSGTALDTERARAQLSGTLADIPMLQAEIAAARQRLGVLTTRAPEELASELGDVPPPVTLPGRLTVSDDDVLALRRPDVRGAERQVAASSAFVDAARAEYLPRVALVGAAGYTSNAFDALGNSGTPRYAIGPVITWPALDFARVKASVDAARAGELEAEARYQQTLLRARAEIRTTIIAYRRSRERLQHLEEAAEASERAAELARLRYAEGASDFLQVLDAERSLLEAQDRSALGQTHAAAALVAVYRAVGGALPTSPAGSR